MANVTFDDDHPYCKVSDVSKLFRKEGEFDAGDNPSRSEVKSLIKERSAFIDRQTRRSWRENKVKDEYHSFDAEWRWDAGRPVMLNKLDIITPFDSTKGDKIEVRDGSKWTDWVADSSIKFGRDEDYWYDESIGQLFLYKRFTWHSQPQIRVSYRYGNDVSVGVDEVPDAVPYDVRMACAKLVAIDLLSSDQFSQLVPGGGDGMSPQQAIQQYRADVFGDQNTDGVIERLKHDPAWIDAY